MTGETEAARAATERLWQQLSSAVDGGLLTATPPYACPYLAGRQASMRAFRAERLPGELYQRLMDRGFRRTGDVFYTMACDGCRACVPLRVPVATFVPTKSQRRALRRNRDVAIRVAPPEFTIEKWQLYRRYLAFQHDREEPDETPESFAETLYGDVVDTLEATYTVGGRLVGATILDVGAVSVSSVYHFFEPAEHRRGLGVFSVLAEIEWTRAQGIPFYYLGYWVNGSATMQYKANYGPHELLQDGRWRAADQA